MVLAGETEESPSLEQGHADAYMRAGDRKAAKRYYEKSLKLDPKNDGARENLKKIKEAAGK